MTLSQEKLGWKTSMQSWDRAVWLAAFGMEEDLRGHVAVPNEFLKRRKAIAAVAADQVPIWSCRRAPKRRTVFAAHEKVSSSKQSRKATGGKKVIMKMSDMQWSQSLPEQVKKLAEKATNEGMTQTRSGAGGEGEDEKFRITLELRHALLKFFGGPQVAPEYVELPPIW